MRKDIALVIFWTRPPPNASSFSSNNATWRLCIYVLFFSVFRTSMPLDSESVSKSCLKPDMIPCQWVMQYLQVSKY